QGADREGKRGGMRRAGVDEVDGRAADRRAELRQLVEARLLGSPVVLVAPIHDEVAQISDRKPVLPPCALDLVGEARLRQADAEIVEDLVVDPDLEALDQRTTTGSVAHPRT